MARVASVRPEPARWEKADMARYATPLKLSSKEPGILRLLLGRLGLPSEAGFADASTRNGVAPCIPPAGWAWLRPGDTIRHDDIYLMDSISVPAAGSYASALPWDNELKKPKHEELQRHNAQVTVTWAAHDVKRMIDLAELGMVSMDDEANDREDDLCVPSERHVFWWDMATAFAGRHLLPEALMPDARVKLAPVARRIRWECGHAVGLKQHQPEFENENETAGAKVIHQYTLESDHCLVCATFRLHFVDKLSPATL